MWKNCNQQLTPPVEDQEYADIDEGEEYIGQTTSELVYYPLKPCRIVDTRFASRWGFNPIPTNGQFNLDVYGNTSSQGGAASCGVSSDAAGVVLNVTAVPTASGNGWLTVWPFGSSKPTASLVNYNAASTSSAIANAVVQSICKGCSDHLSVFARYSSDVVIDVLGYFARPSKTAVESVIQTTTINIPANGNGHGEALCPSGYRITGGGCHWNHYNTNCQTMGSRPWLNGWACDGRNNLSSVQGFHTHAVCTRMPGR